MLFKDKTIMVTGAASSLGKVIASTFIAQGGRVLITDTDAETGKVTASDLGQAAQFFPLDVTREDDWERAMAWVANQWHGLDILINNAGYFKPNIAFEDMPLDLWRKHFSVNSDGVFLGCKHAIRLMKTRAEGGSIVNIGSGMSIKANPLASAYCGSKAAVLMTTRTAAASAGRYNIRVNAVLPGAIPGAMLLGNLTAGQTEEQLVAELEGKNTLGRLATAMDVARAVLFLTAPENINMTGTYLPVDAGNL